MGWLSGARIRVHNDLIERCILTSIFWQSVTKNVSRWLVFVGAAVWKMETASQTWTFRLISSIRTHRMPNRVWKSMSYLIVRSWFYVQKFLLFTQSAPFEFTDTHKKLKRIISMIQRNWKRFPLRSNQSILSLFLLRGISRERLSFQQPSRENGNFDIHFSYLHSLMLLVHFRQLAPNLLGLSVELIYRNI